MSDPCAVKFCRHPSSITYGWDGLGRFPLCDPHHEVYCAMKGDAKQNMLALVEGKQPGTLLSFLTDSKAVTLKTSPIRSSKN